MNYITPANVITLQTVMFALVGPIFLSNPVHRLLNAAMYPLLYKAHFYVATGLWMIGIAAANYFQQFAVSQGLLAVLMGGAVWHHVEEGKPAASIGCALFLAQTVFVATTKASVPLYYAVLCAFCLAGLGWAIGDNLLAMGGRSRPDQKKADHHMHHGHEGHGHHKQENAQHGAKHGKPNH